MLFQRTSHFVAARTMSASSPDLGLVSVAAAIADPARARMLCSLLDGCARTATELAAVARIGASTASGHFSKMRQQGLVDVVVQGKHRYYRLAHGEVGAALEALLVLTGASHPAFKPTTPPELCFARTCYRHMAGDVAVAVHDAFLSKGLLTPSGNEYALTAAGAAFLEDLGLTPAALQAPRRSQAKPCMDWSVRRPHIGGVLGDALLSRFAALGWVERQHDSRALRLTPVGCRQLARRFDEEPERRFSALLAARAQP